MATQIMKRFPDKVILMSMIAHDGNVKQVAEELCVGTGVIYRRLRDQKFQEALTGPIRGDVFKAYRKAVDLIDDTDKSIALQAIKIILNLGGHYIGLSQHSTVTEEHKVGGVLVVPMPLDEKEWEKQAQEYYRKRKIEQDNELLEEPEEEDTVEDYGLRELDFSDKEEED